MNTRTSTLNASLLILFLTFMTGKISAQCAPGEDTTPPTINACAVPRDFIGCDVTAISDPAYSATTATSSEAVFEDATNQGDVTDNCTIASVTYVDVATGTCPITVIRTWTIFDTEGNSTPCDQVITVTDNAGPVITTGASAGTSECEGAVPDANIGYLAWLTSNGGAVAIDACDNGVNWSNNTATAVWTGTCPQTITIIFTASDNCGNVNTTSADFTITDLTPPVITTIATGSSSACQGANPDVNTDYLTWLANNGGAAASDLCGGGVTWSNNSNTATWLGTCPQGIVIIFSASDDCGNINTTSAVFLITDLTGPDITTPASPGSAECQGLDPNINTGYTAWLATNGGAIASDLCGSGVTWSDNSGAAIWTGTCTQTTTIDFTATDGCGNASMTSAVFTITDLTGPAITTPASAASSACEGASPNANTNYLTWLTGNGGAIASDVCSGVTWSNNSGTAVWTGTCPQTITIIFTASDDCGNVNTTSADFTITDVTAPVIILPASPGIAECQGLDPNVNTGYTVWLATNGGAIATDLCSGVTWSNDSGTAIWTGTCTQTTTIVFTASDDCGNTNTTFSTFTITDNLPPVVTTPAGSLDASVECSDVLGLAEALASSPAATDNCAPTLTLNLVSDVTTPDGLCPNAYTRERIWTFDDGCGNTSLPFIQIINVVDFTAPVVTTPAGSLDATVECLDAATLAATLALSPAATDNCTVTPTMVLVSDITTPDGVCPNGYVRIRVWNFTDGCGNTSAAFTQTITVVDILAPVVTTPAGSLDATLGCSDPLGLATALALFPAATDNCTAVPTLTLASDVTTPGICPNAYTRVRYGLLMMDAETQVHHSHKP